MDGERWKLRPGKKVDIFVFENAQFTPKNRQNTIYKEKWQLEEQQLEA